MICSFFQRGYSAIDIAIAIVMADQATSQAALSSPTSPAPKRVRSSSPKGTADAPAEAQQKSSAGQEASATATSPSVEDDVVEAVCNLVGGYGFVAH